MFYASLNATLSSKTSTESRDLKSRQHIYQKPIYLDHWVDKKHYSLHVKIDARFITSFMRKFMSNKKRHFSWGMVHAFLQNRGLKKIGQLSSYLNWRRPKTHGI
jgi:hypothetical protein